MKKNFKKNSALEVLTKQAQEQAQHFTSNDEVKKNIVVYERFKEFIAPLEQEERQGLEESILKEGIRDALILWKKNKDEYVVVDGHNRYEIAQKHQLDFNYTILDFENEDAVESWMITNQLSRRNTTDAYRKYLIGQQYELEKRMQGTNRFTSDDTGKTRDKIAQLTNVSASSVARAAKFFQAINTISDNDKQIRHHLLNQNLSAKDIDFLVSQATKNEGEFLPQLYKELKEKNTLLDFIKQAKKPISSSKKEFQKVSKKEFELLKTQISQLVNQLNQEKNPASSTVKELVVTLQSTLKKIQ